jgi:hypothetical protein
MSHCWSASFGDLVAAACHGARSDRYVWIDIFAVRQWPGNGADLDFRSFIGNCKAVILSISTVDGLVEWMGQDKDRAAFLLTPAGIAARKALPTFRLWCIVEIAAAILRGIAVVVKGGRVRTNDNGTTFFYNSDGAVGMMENLSYMINVVLSECAVQADYDREIKAVRAMSGGNGVQYVNDAVQGVVVGAAALIGENVLEIDSYMCGEPESLRKLTMNVGATGDERWMARKVMTAACAGGRLAIVKELIHRWIGVEKIEKEKEIVKEEVKEVKEETDEMTFDEKDESSSRLHFVCTHEYGVACRNSPQLDDRCQDLCAESRPLAVYQHDLVIGTLLLSADEEWIHIVKSNDPKMNGMYLPI